MPMPWVLMVRDLVWRFVFLWHRKWQYKCSSSKNRYASISQFWYHALGERGGVGYCPRTNRLITICTRADCYAVRFTVGNPVQKHPWSHTLLRNKTTKIDYITHVPVGTEVSSTLNQFWLKIESTLTTIISMLMQCSVPTGLSPWCMNAVLVINSPGLHSSIISTNIMGLVPFRRLAIMHKCSNDE